MFGWLLSLSLSCGVCSVVCVLSLSVDIWLLGSLLSLFCDVWLLFECCLCQLAFGVVMRLDCCLSQLFGC